MTHWRLHLGSAWLRSAFDLWLWGHVMKEIYIGAELCEDQRYLGLSVTTNHHLRWSDILERAVQPLSTCTIFRMRLNMENVDKATKPQTASGDQRHTGVPLCGATRQANSHTFPTSNKIHNTVSPERSAVIKAWRPNRSDQGFSTAVTTITRHSIRFI